MKNLYLFIVIIIITSNSIIAQSFTRFENYIKSSYNLEKIKLDLEKDYKLNVVGEKQKNGSIAYDYVKIEDENLYVTVLFSEIFNVANSVFYSDKLEKLPVLMDFLKKAGYTYLKKVNEKGNDGEYNGIEKYGYRKGDILVALKVGAEEGKVIVQIINQKY